MRQQPVWDDQKFLKTFYSNQRPVEQEDMPDFFPKLA